MRKYLLETRCLVVRDLFALDANDKVSAGEVNACETLGYGIWDQMPLDRSMTRYLFLSFDGNLMSVIIQRK